MDPNAAFNDMSDALEARDLKTAAAIATDLCEWITNGGFKPKGFTSRWESDEFAHDFYTGYTTGS